MPDPACTTHLSPRNGVLQVEPVQQSKHRQLSASSNRMPLPLHDSRDMSATGRSHCVPACIASSAPLTADLAAGRSELELVDRMSSMPKKTPFMPRLAAVSDDTFGFHV